MKSSNRFSQKQLLLPLLNTVADLGGTVKPIDAIDELTRRMQVPSEIVSVRKERENGRWRGTKFSPWKSSVHWTRMTAVEQGLLDRQKGIWSLTDKGYDSLGRCRPGVIIRIYETPSGQFLWAEAQSVVRLVEDKSMNLIFTSPPYKLSGKQRSYGNLTGDEYHRNLLGLTREWKRTLTDDGSLVVNLGHVWIDGSPGVRDPYIFRYVTAVIDELGMSLCDIHHWLNTAGGPRGFQTTNARTRLNNNVEDLLWFSPTGRPKANNRAVLRPYAKATLKAYARKRNHPRTYANPSGRNSNGTADPAQTGGAIPSTCLQIPNSNSNDAYIRGCRAAGIKPHDARFPMELARFHIKFLTDPGDMVGDFMGGSGVVAEACEELDRNWLLVDCMRQHIEGSLHRPLLGARAARSEELVLCGQE